MAQSMSKFAPSSNLSLMDPRIADITDHAIQPNPFLSIVIDRSLIRQFGELQPVHPSRHFIKHFPETVDIRLFGPGTFRWYKSLRPNKGPLIFSCNQTDISQLSLTINEDHVRWFHITVGQSPLV